MCVVRVGGLHEKLGVAGVWVGGSILTSEAGGWGWQGECAAPWPGEGTAFSPEPWEPQVMGMMREKDVVRTTH